MSACSGYIVRNWSKFQHYKDRSPPWLKLHRELLDSMDYALLSPVSAKCLPLIWLLASEGEGSLPDIDRLAFRLRLSTEQAEQVATELANRGFLDGSGAYSEPKKPVQKSNPSRYIPDKVRLAVMTRDNGLCVWCQSDENIEFDHIIPVSKGGKSGAENVQLLCRSCNRKKRTRDSEQAEQLATTILSRRSLEGETETEIEGETDSETDERQKVVARKPAQPTTAGSVAWTGYADAYQLRYSELPVRNAKTNAQMKQLVQRLGADEAPMVAAFYVSHNSQFYVSRGHAVDLLVKDAEKLRTEWVTGRTMTATIARQTDQADSNPFLRMLKNGEGNAKAP